MCCFSLSFMIVYEESFRFWTVGLIKSSSLKTSLWALGKCDGDTWETYTTKRENNHLHSLNYFLLLLLWEALQVFNLGSCLSIQLVAKKKRKNIENKQRKSVTAGKSLFLYRWQLTLMLVQKSFSFCPVSRLTLVKDLITTVFCSINLGYTQHHILWVFFS